MHYPDCGGDFMDIYLWQMYPTAHFKCVQFLTCSFFKNWEKYNILRTGKFPSTQVKCYCCLELSVSTARDHHPDQSSSMRALALLSLPVPRPEPVLQPAPHYQVFLDGQDAAPGSLAVGPLACDDDGLRVAIFCWKVDLGIAFFTNL